MTDSRIFLIHNNVVLVVILALIPEVKGQICPQGTMTRHHSGLTVCCLPIDDCNPDHYVMSCTRNNTKDTCEVCPPGYKLFKRTSSFAIKSCRPFPFEPLPSCKPTSGFPSTDSSTLDDEKRCHCDLEKGYYYMKPEVSVGSSSFCQPFPTVCTPGYQPGLDGKCEQCPKGTFQNQSTFRFCRPQRNCSALSLDVVEMGNSRSETICAMPSLPPTVPPDVSVPKTNPQDSSKSTGSSPLSSPPSTTGDDNTELKTNQSQKPSGPSQNITIIIIVVSVVGLLGIGVIVVWKRGWFTNHCIRTHSNLEGGAPTCASLPHMPRQDEDNNSANSDCACTDSCLTSSKPQSSSTNKILENGGAKPPGQGLYEGHVNTQYLNGGSLSSEKGSFSEPFYHSLHPQDSGGGNYRNINGSYISPATVLRREDFYGYPTKVALTPSNDKDLIEGKGEKKQCTASPKAPNRIRRADDSKDSCETEPLLAYENLSSGSTTPSQGRTNCSDLQDVALQDMTPAGNRPHLSMLLGSAEPSVVSPAGEALPPNVPHLSQLVSSAPASSTRGFSSVQQQQVREAATLEARLAAAVPLVVDGQQNVNPGVIQLEELKPMMPADQTILDSDRRGDRSTSPARITPVKHEEVRRGRRREIEVSRVGSPRPVQAARPANFAASEQTAASVLTGESEETFRKEAVVSPEDTARKSVGGSSGLGESLEMSSSLMGPLSDDGRQGRNAYRRSNSEVSRSMSPSPSKLPRSISSPEEKHRPIAAVRPIQSDQSLTHQSPGQDLMQPLDSAERNFPLQSAIQLNRQMSQDSTSSDREETRPKTPDRLTEEEEEEEEEDDNANAGMSARASDERTHHRFSSSSDSQNGRDESKERSSDG